MWTLTENTMQKIGFQTTKTNETPAKNWNMTFDVVVQLGKEGDITKAR